jgi:MFS family permease
LLYSYLPFLVHFLLPEVSTVEIGYWSALLGFAYYFGALLGNMGWGLVADRLGRRPVLLVGVLGSGVLACLFGFSRSYWVAVGLRFAWGLLNSVGVSRTALMEILDDSNSAQGMVLFSVVGGLGRLVGPLVGGLASRPALHFRVFQHSVFHAFPFALPALLALFWSSLIWLLAYYELEESLPAHRVSSCSGLLCGRGGLFSSTSSSSFSDAHYSILGSGAGEDTELDVSTSPDRTSSSRADSPFSSPFGALSSDKRAGDGSSSLGIELQSTPTYANDEDEDEEEEGEDGSASQQGAACANQQKEKKKGVTFNSYVQMKIMDTSDIKYRKLARVSPEDTPQFYSAGERDSNYSRSGSYLQALLGGGAEQHQDQQEEEEEGQDLDASTRSLVVSSGAAVSGGDLESSGDRVERYTNGSELVESQDLEKDFRRLNLCGTLQVLTKSKLIYFTSLTYFLLVLAYSTLNEIIPLWLVIPAAEGGFGFNGVGLGLALFVSGPVSLGMQLGAFPAAVHQRGLLPLVRTCLAVFALIAVVTPALCIPALQLVPVLPRALVVLAHTALTVAADWALVITYVFINNSCYGYQRATVNGFTQALACLAMMLASLAGSSFFALCESNSLKEQLPWPFHYAVVFWCIALVANAARQTTYYLHRKIQKVRREPRFPRYAVQMEHFSIERSGVNTDDDDIDDDNR